MPNLFLGFKGQRAKAHLLLLSKFLSPHTVEDFSQSGDWGAVLGEPPSQSIKRFQNEGLVLQGNLEAQLTYQFKLNDLKSMLKQRGLATSGRKDALIQRLLQTDLQSMMVSVQGLTVLQCSQRGRETAESYLTDEQMQRTNVEHRVTEFVRRREFREASCAVASFEAKQVFPRGLAIDWRRHDPARDIATLTLIFNSRPKILGQLPDGKLETLRIGASMMRLWGTNTAKEWVPTTFDTGLAFDNDTGARMFLFLALHQTNLSTWRQSGVVKYVEVSPAQDSCDNCKKLAGKRYPLNEVSELPHEHCTHIKGCRCVFIPITKSYNEILSDK